MNSVDKCRPDHATVGGITYFSGFSNAIRTSLEWISMVSKKFEKKSEKIEKIKKNVLNESKYMINLLKQNFNAN